MHWGQYARYGVEKCMTTIIERPEEENGSLLHYLKVDCDKLKI